MMESPASYSRVSIHAPAWGATATYRNDGIAFVVSIHAPAWGATAAGEKSGASVLSFNPRPRVGGDQSAA